MRISSIIPWVSNYFSCVRVYTAMTQVKNNISNFEIGDELIIDEKNADAWANTIGKPLAEELKKIPHPGEANFIVTCADRHNGTITIARIKK